MSYNWSFRALGILLAFVLTFETACRTWVEKPVQPDTNVGVGRHRLVRVITNDGDSVTMRAVAFVGSPSTPVRDVCDPSLGASLSGRIQRCWASRAISSDVSSVPA